MTMILMGAGGVIAAGGLIAVLFGIPVKEFSTGNLLILSGVAIFCSGLLLVALGAVLGELRHIAALLEPQAEPAQPPVAEPKSLRPPAHDLFTPEDEPVAVAEAAPPAEPPPWTLPLREARLPEPPAPAREEFAFRRPGGKPVASAGEPESRERAQPEPRTMFDSLWPSRKRDQSDDSPPAVDSRPEPAVSEPELADEALPAEPAPVTVIKSGVIDGMAYSLFSDGSIEAELADGIIRFASIEELRAHLDRRN